MKKIIFIICLILVGFDLALQISYLNPSYKTANSFVDVYSEPFQKNFEKMKMPIIVFDLYKRPYSLDAQAKYSISAMISAKNYNFGSRLLMKKGFNSIVPIDFGLVWGKLANRDLMENHFKFTSKDVIFARRLLFQWDEHVAERYSTDYVVSHISHTHIIPKNHNILSALVNTKKYQKIQLNGYLVDVFDDKAQRFAMTSLSRADTDESSRGAGQGGGACEIMYVISVQIEDKIYE